jgi:DNA (cytosine-5)-methyltransferase 1
MGQRVLQDPRNALVFHFSRLVIELKPRTFVMENVPGMATGEHTQLLAELVEHFREAGYRVRLPYKTLNAGNFGVPQDRWRLFLIGARSDTRLPAYPEPWTRLPGNARRRNGDTLPLSIEDLSECPTVQDAIGDLPNIEDHESLENSDELRVKLRGGSRYARTLRGELLDLGDYSYPRKSDAELLTGCLRARHTEVSRKRFAATAAGTTEAVSHFFKLPADGVCNTLRAGTATDRGAFSAPRPIHPIYPRCISVREAARLHSYPDWFRFHRTIWHGFRQIGNSVPPLLARAVAARIVEALGATPIHPRESLVLGPERLAYFNMREAAAYFGVSPSVIAPRKRLATATRR